MSWSKERASPDLSDEEASTERARLRTAIKARDVWWPAFVIGPLANRLVGVLARFERIHPNHVTLVSALVAGTAAVCLSLGDYPWLVAGGVLMQLAFLLDCADGQLARYRGLASPFGAALDRIIDRLKMGPYLLALAWGSFRREPDVSVWVAAFITCFGFYVVHVYAQQYRQLAERFGRGAGAVPPVRFWWPLRVLDVAFVRPLNAEHLLLISIACFVDRVPVVLYALAVGALIQTAFRPAYYLFALRRDLGVWPWRVS